MPKPTRRVFPFSKHRSRIADLVSRPICESPQTKAHNTPQKRSRPLRRSSQVNLHVTHNFDALADMLAQWAKAVRREQRRAEARCLESRERPWQPRSEHFVAIGPPKRRRRRSARSRRAAVSRVVSLLSRSTRLSSRKLKCFVREAQAVKNSRWPTRAIRARRAAATAPRSSKGAPVLSLRRGRACFHRESDEPHIFITRRSRAKVR